MEYVLPINADSEVGVVKQEFKAARDLVEATLVQLKQIPELAVRRLLTQRTSTECKTLASSNMLTIRERSSIAQTTFTTSASKPGTSAQSAKGRQH